MKAETYMLSLDQGTTSSRAIIFNRSGEIVAISQQEFHQHFPHPGWVEHDPKEIWSSQVSALAGVMAKSGIGLEQIHAIGITNQRETIIAWNRETGEPACNAIVWQDRRTANYCKEVLEKKYRKLIQDKTGLVPDAYFSASKMRWVLDNHPQAQTWNEAGLLVFGTVDTWLIWKLTLGKSFVTDITNASRTMLFNIHTLEWDETLLELFALRKETLPEVKENHGLFGMTDPSITRIPIPIHGVAGDQQAALFGQMCLTPGMVKNTYGTGCFMVANAGEHPPVSQHQLLTTIGWKMGPKPVYALEGSIFIGGAIVQWLRDGLGMIRKSAEIEPLAASVEDNLGVYLVPALTGLGAPYWNAEAQGLISGITRGTKAGHIARAAIESIAFQVHDVWRAMEEDLGQTLKEFRADGGATQNNLLMQFQADLLGIPVIRARVQETTALGAAYFAGLGSGFWSSTEAIKDQWKAEKQFSPQMPTTQVQQLIHGWNHAIRQALVTKEIRD